MYLPWEVFFYRFEYVEENSDQPEDTKTEEADMRLAHLLGEFEVVLANPKGLPPTRAQHHNITLEPTTGPINVKPYRRSQFQKAKIEKIVQEMLHQKMVRESNNPYSSPILLVKKKDGSWRLCVDYRALNKITIKDRFPIPTVDEILAELRVLAFSQNWTLGQGTIL